MSSSSHIPHDPSRGQDSAQTFGQSFSRAFKRELTNRRSRRLDRRRGPTPGAQPSIPPLVLLLLAIAQIITIPAQLIAALRFEPTYSFLSRSVSDLATTTCTTVTYPYGDVPVCSPLHQLMNVAIIVAGFALVDLGLLGFRRQAGLRGIAGLAWILTGASIAAFGLMAMTTSAQDSRIFLTVSLLSAPVAVLLSAWQLRGRLRVSGLVVTLVSIGAAGIHLAWADNPHFGGALERLAAWPPAVWLLVAMWAAVRRPDPRTAGTAPGSAAHTSRSE